MTVLKCKMCGGDLQFKEGNTVVECEYCGTKQTVPNMDDERKLALFARANRLRFACEFDKASGVYESIVADFPEEAEAYWGLVLCKYGIEYVDDPATGKKVPTCHRSSFDSVMDDDDFEQTLENADPIARAVYREEAKQMEGLRRGIIEVSGKEEPYDIFICYKETDDNGERTIDSVMAQDVYQALTEKGYRVFFSRISLEDKLGQEYEPYIFAALNSAKVMLAFGTDYERYNAVWVKNEWSRFLQLIARGEKKTLIPCYKSIDAYDMPKEFAKLQAQDMSKVGAVQDLLRGIEKLLPRNKETQVQEGRESAAAQSAERSATVASLLKRAFLFLEDGDWKNAADYCNRVLDVSPEHVEAYVGLLMAELQVKKEGELAGQKESFRQNKNFLKALRFAGEERRRILEGYDRTVEDYLTKKKNRLEERRRQLAEKRALGSISIARYFDDDENEHHYCIFAKVWNHNAKKEVTYTRGSYPWTGMDIISITEGDDMAMAGLKSDGTVVKVGAPGYLSTAHMKEITAVWAVDYNIIGVKYDGNIVVAGWFEDITDWKNLIAVVREGGACQEKWVAGLKSDGTVAVKGWGHNHKGGVDSWKNIIALATAGNLLAGLKSDGTVVTADICHKDDEEWFSGTSEWREIVAIDGCERGIAGLRSDGTVVAAFRHGEGAGGVLNQLANWKDIDAIVIEDWADATFILGLKADGTVVVADNKYHMFEDVAGWKDIIAIAATRHGAAGLKADGTILVSKTISKEIEEGEKWVKKWVKEKIEREEEKIKQREEKRIKRKEERIKREEEAVRRQSNLCQYCGGPFKGLISKKCSICGKPKDY